LDFIIERTDKMPLKMVLLMKRFLISLSCFCEVIIDTNT